MGPPGNTDAATRAGLGQLKNAFIREDRILPHLPGLHLLLTEPAAGQQRRRTRRGVDVRIRPVPKDVIRYLRERQITLWSPSKG